MIDMQVWDDWSYIPVMDGIWDDELSLEELYEVRSYAGDWLDIEGY
jgi:hypothetical protein